MPPLPPPPFAREVFDEQWLTDAAGGEVTAFREALTRGTEALHRLCESGTPIRQLVAGRAWLIDQLLLRAWQSRFGGPAEIALVAVGGYGRGELHPASDIDLMLLLGEGVEAEALREAIESFLTFLWDIGLEVGHSVRNLSQCVQEAEQDITVATNLMEARLLDGPEPLFRRMKEKTGPSHIWPSDRFFDAKWREQQARHEKFHDTAYNLEPNIKEGPGGLRDIQMIGWVAKRHFGADTLHDLVEHHFLTEQEYQALTEGQDFLWRIRWGLHKLTGRREDRLLFDHQPRMAERLGYRDSEAALGVEQFMQDYYRTVIELSRLNEMLLQLFQEAILLVHEPAEPVTINRRFQARRGFLEVTDNQIFLRYPFALLELFVVMAGHPELKGVRASTIRLIRGHRHLIDERFRNDIRARSLFMELLRQPHGVTHELRRMNRYGILAAYLPPFANIVGRMQYDLFHAYTVDEHTLFVVRNLRRFTVPEHAHEFPLCSQLVRELPKPELLYIAGLFHDIAKGRGGDHSVLGEEDALHFCRHHDLSEADARLVAWLVRNHLIMSMTAQRKDISDPEVVQAFAEQVHDKLHLDHLYLLTVADIRATNPTLWNAWKDALLRDLYNATKRALRRGLENPIDAEERIRDTQQEALRLLREGGIDEREVSLLWEEMPPEYFLRYSAEEIAWHSRGILEHRGEEPPLVLIQPHGLRGATAIFIYGPIRDRLFAATTATAEQMGLSIVDARVIASHRHHTLDTYLALEEDGRPVTDPARLEEIRLTLRQRLRDPATVSLRVARRQPRQMKYFEANTRVTFSDDTANHRTVMEVITKDRPGLLSRVGQAFALCGIRLHNARIATIGHRAEDVFFITDLENRPLDDEGQREKLRRTVEELLTGC